MTGRRRAAGLGAIGLAFVAVAVVLLLPISIQQNPAAARTRASTTTTSIAATTTTAPGQIPIYEFTGSFVSTRCGSVIAPRHYRSLDPAVPIAESLTGEECRIERDRRLFYAIVVGVAFLIIGAGFLIRRLRRAPYVAVPIGGLIAALALVGVVHRI